MIRSHTAEATAQLEADWPRWQIWWVPRATGRPVITWHARRRDDEKHVIHAETATELEELLTKEGTDER
jgi:hypothetical protein